MKNHSIMIVDDNEADVYLLKRVFEKAKFGSQVFEAENGQVALDFFLNDKENSEKFGAAFPPSIIFLDVNMPIMGGFEFLEHFNELKAKRESLKSVVFTMFSSSERSEDLEKVSSYDFVKGFVTKGALTAENLKKTLQEILPDALFSE